MTDIYKDMEVLLEDARSSDECSYDFYSAMIDLIQEAREDNDALELKLQATSHGYLGALGELGASVLHGNKLSACVKKFDGLLVRIADWHRDHLTDVADGYGCDEFGGERWTVGQDDAEELGRIITDAQNVIPRCMRGKCLE